APLAEPDRRRRAHRHRRGQRQRSRRDRRARHLPSVKSFLALGVLAAAALPGAASGRSGTLHLVHVVQVAAPVYATTAPGEPGRLYIVEQAGRIVVLENGRIRSSPFLDIRRQVVSGGEQGLLSVAFDPQYRTNHRFYVDYTDTNGDTR